jgi:hypothetical protein
MMAWDDLELQTTLRFPGSISFGRISYVPETDIVEGSAGYVVTVRESSDAGDDT